MKSAFLPRLVNGPFGDPGLYVALRWQGTALQFDLGRLDRFPAAEILKLTHVFVSHTHIDHFIGFDRLMRLFLAREATIALFGPPGIIRNVSGKLAGYTWNLVEGYPFVLDVHEVYPDRIERVRLRATTAFAIEPTGTQPFSGVLHENSTLAVRAVHLDHRIPCLGFAVAEKNHLNVRTDELERLRVPAGPWLNQLKDAIRTGQSDDAVITARWPQQGSEQRMKFRLGDLRDRLVVETPGQKLAYVVDTLFSKENLAKIVALAGNADIFFCESLFLDEDRDQALKRYHLTARQAGTLARLAGVKRLEVFHFSPRYDGMADRLYAEAEAALRGDIAADEPV
ncbi:MAG TPA: ribonuclease Z [Burkholderiales bacterium]|nr:ribonuclease Z [Burkholderiales bacterium]